VRALKVSSLVAADGVFEDPQSWAKEFFEAEAVDASLAALDAADAMLMGRHTYEYFEPVWSPASGPYMDRINALRKYVLSATLGEATWNNSVVLAGPATAEVERLKGEGDGDLVVYGCGRLARSLLEAGLVDELSLAVHPLILGSGRPVLGGGERLGLSLRSVDQRPNGVVTLSYAAG
jgi:dihydrofolate reductase